MHLNVRFIFSLKISARGSPFTPDNERSARKWRNSTPYPKTRITWMKWAFYSLWAFERTGIPLIIRKQGKIARRIKKWQPILHYVQDVRQSRDGIAAPISHPPRQASTNSGLLVRETWIKSSINIFNTSKTRWTNHNIGNEQLTGTFDRFTRVKARNGCAYRLLVPDGHLTILVSNLWSGVTGTEWSLWCFPLNPFIGCNPWCIVIQPLSTAYTHDLIQYTDKSKRFIGLLNSKI